MSRSYLRSSVPGRLGKLPLPLGAGWGEGLAE